MKALTVLTMAVLAAAIVPSALAGQDKPAHAPRKYDFALVRKEGGIASFGSFDQEATEKFKAAGPGLYVKKDGANYVITDPETIRKTEDALQTFKDIGKKFKMDHRSASQDAREKQISARSKEQAELARKMSEEAKAYSEKMRQGTDPQTQAKFREKMRQLQEQMKTLSKSQMEFATRQRAFGKEMAEFGRQMRLAADQAGEKITVLIDQAFAKGLAKRL